MHCARCSSIKKKIHCHIPPKWRSLTTGSPLHANMSPTKIESLVITLFICKSQGDLIFSFRRYHCPESQSSVFFPLHHCSACKHGRCRALISLTQGKSSWYVQWWWLADLGRVKVRPDKRSLPYDPALRRRNVGQHIWVEQEVGPRKESSFIPLGAPFCTPCNLSGPYL